MDQPQQHSPGNESAELDIDLQAIARSLWRRRYIVLGVLAACMVIGVLITVRATRIYKASATVQIDQSAPEVLGEVREVYDLGSRSYWASREYYETQYNVIRSRPVAQRAANALGLAPSVLIEQLQELGAESVAARMSGDPLADMPSELLQPLKMLGLDRLRNRDSMLEALEKLDVATLLQARVMVEPVKDSRLVRIAIEDKHPEHAAIVANAVVEAYLTYNLEQRSDVTRSAVDWLSDQVLELKHKLHSAELALHEFKRASNIVSVSMEDKQTIIAASLSQLNQSLSTAQAHRIGLESRRRRLQHAKSQGISLDASEEVMKNSYVQELKSKYADAKSEETGLAAKYTAEHPKLAVVQRKSAMLKADLDQEIAQVLFNLEEQYLTAVDTESRLRAAIEEIKAEAMELNKKEIEYNRLRRERDNNQALYDLVLKRQKETDLTQLLKVNNVHKLEPAQVPTIPIRPRTRMNIALALVMGLFLGVGVAFLVDFLDNSIKTQAQVEQRLGLPFLGILPAIKEATKPAEINVRDQFIIHHPHSSVAECSRSIRTNLLFMSHERPARRLLITSSSPQDGKSTTAINLAVTMAQSGRRTLLVDTDMRRPRLHQSFDLDASRGVSNLILGEIDMASAVQSSGSPNLDILPCGPIPPNPAELLHTDSFKQIIEQLSATYDRILFDSPPVAAVADAMVLATIADGVVLVVHAGKTTWQSARAAAHRLESVGANIFGVVLNDVDLDDKRSDNYYQYYYYRKGYEQNGKRKEAVRT